MTTFGKEVNELIKQVIRADLVYKLSELEEEYAFKTRSRNTLLSPKDDEIREANYLWGKILAYREIISDLVGF